MRWIVMIAFALALSCTARAEPAAFQAGVTRLATNAANLAPFETVVFYPTHDRETPWQAGPFTIDATRDAAPATDMRFPVVLLSHGRGGSPLSHRDLAIALARAGFVVVMPTHLGDAAGHPRAATQAQILMDRPQQAEAALNTALASPRFAAMADAQRIGMIGYSAGGYTALILAGAQPDFAAAQTYCAHHDDAGSCPPHAASSANAPMASGAELATWRPQADARIKALVLLDPLGVMFDKAGLSNVRMPTLLYRPQDDAYLGSAGNALAVAAALPTPPEIRVVPGKHFVFIDPCPPAIVAEAALICEDAPGVDRAAIHREMERDIVAFLRAHL